MSSKLPAITVTHKEVIVPDDKAPSGHEKVRVRKLFMKNFMVSNYYHYIEIDDEYTLRKVDSGEIVKRWREKQTKKAYTWKESGLQDLPSEPYWMSYRFQLEEFVNRIKGRAGSGVWVDAEDSIAQTRMIDMAYEKSDLPLRPGSKFKLEDLA